MTGEASARVYGGVAKRPENGFAFNCARASNLTGTRFQPLKTAAPITPTSCVSPYFSFAYDSRTGLNRNAATAEETAALIPHAKRHQPAANPTYRPRPAQFCCFHHRADAGCVIGVNQSARRPNGRDKARKATNA